MDFKKCDVCEKEMDKGIINGKYEIMINPHKFNDKLKDADFSLIIKVDGLNLDICPDCILEVLTQ